MLPQEGTSAIEVDEFLADDDVGEEHPLFDHELGLLADIGPELGGVLSVVELEAELVAFEGDGAVLEALVPAVLGDLVEEEELGVEVVEVDVVGEPVLVLLVGDVLYLVGDEEVDHVVAELGAGLDDGLGEPGRPVPEHGAIPGDVEEGGEGQPLHAGVERAEGLAEHAGQHGQHAVDQVDRGGPQLGLPVGRAVGFHEVTHVRDVHAHLEHA